MTVIIKVGRRTTRKKGVKWLTRQMRKMKSFNMMQNYLWQDILYAFKLVAGKVNKYKKDNPGKIIFKRRKYVEADNDNLMYVIEWVELMFEGTDEFEQEEYTEALRFFSKIGDIKHFNEVRRKTSSQKDFVVDPELSKEYDQEKMKKGYIKTMMNKGYKKVKQLTMSKVLNDIGIIPIVERYESESQKETRLAKEKLASCDIDEE